MPLFCLCPMEEIADRISESYKNGAVGLAGPSVYPLAGRLIKQGNPVATGKSLTEGHVRLIVGGGGQNEILRARKLACGKRLMLLPSICNTICFLPYRDTNDILSEPETVIYDLREDRQTRADAYAAMLGLLAECADAAASGERDKGFFLLGQKIRRMLSEPMSFPAWAEFIARASEVLYNAGDRLYSGLSFCSLSGKDALFFTNYLIVAVIIQFTKYDFNGIFIGKEKAFFSKPECKKTLPARLHPDTAARLKGMLPDGRELKNYAERYLWEAGKKHFDAPPPTKIFSALLEEEERTQDKGLLASMCRAGMIDRMKLAR